MTSSLETVSFFFLNFCCLEFFFFLTLNDFLIKVNEAMLGLKKAEAGSDMIVAKKKKKQKELVVVSKEDFEEEWGGITADV